MWHPWDLKRFQKQKLMTPKPYDYINVTRSNNKNKKLPHREKNITTRGRNK